MAKVFEVTITDQTSDFFNNNLNEISCFEKANQTMHGISGIINFFDDNKELEMLKKSLSETDNVLQEPDRTEYGDFQTNSALADKVTIHLNSKGISPEIVIEPTCGKGNFIIESLRNFKNIETIIGIEIYKPYIWESKFRVVDFFLSNPKVGKPEISIIHCNVFDFDFKNIAKKYSNKKILIIGNPPWVTNSKLGTLNSNNLPKKQISKIIVV